LKEASEEFGGHALALTLLGNYLSFVHEGEIRKRDLMPALTVDEKRGGHTRRVMGSYEKWLKGTAELDILYLMGLFDRPAEMGAIEVLRAEPAIKGLTENLADLSETKWKYAIKRLRGLGMLAKADEEVTLDCHPLVREHFGEKLEKEKAEAWREAHGRLYEYYKVQPEKLYNKHLPDTLEEMEPLFQAIYHGCAASKYQETFDEVYWERINRGDAFYSTDKLGAFGSDLGAVSCFFEELWSRPAEGLKDSDKALVLNQAGFALRAVGRLREAAEPIRAGMELSVKQKDWKGVAPNAGNLSELYLTVGEVVKAVEFADRSVEYADRSGDAFQKMSKRTTLGDALHQAGQVERAKELFEEAEQMQKEEQAGYPFLYSLQGYQYCDLLLSLGRVDEVKERASQTLEWAKQRRLSLLDIVLDQLSLGRAQLLEYQKLKIKNKKDNEKNKKALAEAKKWLEGAVAGLREAAQQYFIPPGLFARAKLYREMGDMAKARGDAAEAREIAERGGMGLWMVDVLLEEGRIYLAMGDKVKARECGEKCKGLIEETGYHRRDSEAEELIRC
jgi:tetratricopeptide (TPR) repeat protein